MSNLAKESDSVSHLTSTSPPSRPQSIGQAMESISRSVSSEINSATNSTTEAAGRYLETTRKFVKERPMQSIAIATAAGAAIGTIFAMFRSAKR